MNDKDNQTKDTKQENSLSSIIHDCDLLLKSGNFSSLSIRAKELLKADPGLSIVWNFLGLAEKNIGNLDAANAAFEEVTQLNPDNFEGYNNLGICLAERGKLDIAIVTFKKALDLPGASVETHFNLGYTLELKDQNEEARNVFQKITELNPALAEAWNRLGSNCAKLNLIAEATNSYDKACSINPNIPEVYFNKGTLLVSTKKFDEALKYFEKAISLYPEYLTAIQSKGNILLQRGNNKGAILSFKEVVRLDPKYTEAWNNLGVAYREEKKLNIAEKMFRLALNSRAGDIFAANNLLNILCEGRDFERAVDEAQKLSQETSFNSETYFILGNIYSGLGKLTDAIHQYEAAISSGAKSPKVWNNIGVALRNMGKPVEAIRAYETALSIDNEFAEAICNLGMALLDAGNEAEAIKRLNQSTTLIPSNVDAHYNSALAYFSIGRIVETTESLLRAIHIQPERQNLWRFLVYPLSVQDMDGGSSHHQSLSLEHLVNDDKSRKNLSIFRYSLYRGGPKASDFLQGAIEKTKSQNHVLISNLADKNRSGPERNRNEEEVVCLIHFGRSGSKLLHSLIDGHPAVSTLPSYYLSEFFDPEQWEDLTRGGLDQVTDRFCKKYPILFDSRSSYPIQTAGGKWLHNIGEKTGLTAVGKSKQEALELDEESFRAELELLLGNYEELDISTFFRLVHRAYNTVCNSLNRKTLIFYDAHNPSISARLNMAAAMPEMKWILTVRDPIQSCESWLRTRVQANDYAGCVHRIVSVLLEVDDLVLSNNNHIGVRLEDIKNNSKTTIRALCEWLGIQEDRCLYEMTMQGMTWWGDPRSPDHKSDGMQPFGKKSVSREVGLIFSEKDRFIFQTFFYPFSCRFGYETENQSKFLLDLEKIATMIEDPFDFEIKMARKLDMDIKNFCASGHYLYFRSVLQKRLLLLKKYHTYPNLIFPLKLDLC